MSAFRRSRCSGRRRTWQRCLPRWPAARPAFVASSSYGRPFRSPTGPRRRSRWRLPEAARPGSPSTARLPGCWPACSPPTRSRPTPPPPCASLPATSIGSTSMPAGWSGPAGPGCRRPRPPPLRPWSSLRSWSSMSCLDRPLRAGLPARTWPWCCEPCRRRRSTPTQLCGVRAGSSRWAARPRPRRLRDCPRASGSTTPRSSGRSRTRRPGGPSSTPSCARPSARPSRCSKPTARCERRPRRRARCSAPPGCASTATTTPSIAANSSAARCEA